MGGKECGKCELNPNSAWSSLRGGLEQQGNSDEAVVAYRKAGNISRFL